MNTMKQIRAGFESKRRFAKLTGLDELIDWYTDLQNTIEDLWKNGSTKDFSDDFLSYANGYQINTGDYENLHIAQALDLRSITATKTGTKALASFILK